MNLISTLAALPRLPRPAVLAIGAFDGIHSGHRMLLRRVAEIARSRAEDALVVTFRPHPSRFLRPESAPPLITRYVDRADRVRELGIDTLLELPFDAAFAALTATEFVEQVLVRAGARHIVAGPDLRFGRDRAGDTACLQRLGELHGFTVESAAPLTVDGAVASSTRVRQLVQAGDVEAAARVLGTPHRVVGTVIHGDHRGRTIGVPTANLATETELLPAPGVYATWTQLDGRAVPSVTNLGMRPTVSGVDLRFETHLLDFEGDLYGRSLAVDLVSRLRAEQRFQGLPELVAQIQADISAARRVLIP